MKHFAVVSEGIVRNIIIANSLEEAELITQGPCVEYAEGERVGIDFTYQDGKFIDPDVLNETPLSEEELRALFAEKGLDFDNPPAPIIEGEVVPPAIEG